MQGYEDAAHKLKEPTIVMSSKTHTSSGISSKGSDRILNQLVLEGSVAGQERSLVSLVFRKSTTTQTNPDFEEIIRDIDTSLNTFTGNLDSNLDLPNLTENKEERLMLLYVLVLEANAKPMKFDFLKESLMINKEQIILAATMLLDVVFM